MSGDHNQYQKSKSYLDDFECPRCGHYCKVDGQETLEYWNAVEGWVKIDEMREHFDSVGCGTIYKSDGEGRVPLYTAPPKKEWVGLTDEEIQDLGYLSEKFDASNSEWFDRWGFSRAIEAKLKEKNHG